ncbi:MAG: hypothetical protein AAF311_02125 [Pseudomonadota bacterium]
MRTLALPLLLSTGLLVACGGTDTPEPVILDDDATVVVDTDLDTAEADMDVEETMSAAEMMIGEWNQETPFEMTVGDNSFTIMNGEAEYEADGTSEIEAMLIVSGQPDGQNSYEIDLDGTYELNGDVLTERFTSAEVEPVVSDDTTRMIAQAIQAALAGTGPTSSTVVSIDEDMLVRRVEGLGELRYSRNMN